MQPGSPRDADLRDNPRLLGVSIRIVSGFSGAASARTQNSKCGFLHVPTQTHRQHALPQRSYLARKKHGAIMEWGVIPSKQLCSKALIFLIPSLFSALLLPASGERSAGW